MQIKAFNLLHESWIKVMDIDGQQKTVSLLEVFREAHKIQALSGEMVAQDIAITRFLLAVLYAVFVRQRVDGSIDSLVDQAAKSKENALNRWESMWKEKAFPISVIEQYLCQYEDRFWLFHPEHPFYQVPFTDVVKGTDHVNIYPTDKSLGALVGDVLESGNKIRLFSGRKASGISYGEAARWLLFLNAFDAAPAGTSKTKDGKSIKGYGVAWLGTLGLIWANGNTLFETLMLNMVMSSSYIHWTSCQPVWEQKPDTTAADLEEIKPAFPQDLCSLYTMQFRKVRLHRSADDSQVISYSLWSGQALDGKNAFLEPMSVWKKGKEGYYPKLHQPSRQMWRDFSSIFASVENIDEHPSGIINWIYELKRSKRLSIPVVKLSIVGLSLTNNTAVEEIFTDSLRVNSGLLEAYGAVWYSKIKDSIGYVNKLVLELIVLMRKLAIACGDDTSKNTNKINDAVEQTFFRMDEPFRRWIDTIDPDNDDPDDMCKIWKDQARQIIISLAAEMVNMAGTRAYVGREVIIDKKAEHEMNARIAQLISEGREIRPAKANGEKTTRWYTSSDAHREFLWKVINIKNG